MALVINFNEYSPQELADQITEDLDDEKLKELVKEIDRAVQEWEFTAELAYWFKKEVEEPEEPDNEDSGSMFDMARDDPGMSNPPRY